MLSLTHEPESTFLMIALSHAASHMCTLAMISEEVVLQMSLRALNGMRRAIHSAPVSKSLAKNNHQPEHLPSYAFSDQVITGAVMLASSEVFRGANTRKVIPMLRGATTLVIERHNYNSCTCSLSHPHRSDFLSESIIYRSSVSVLAYIDVLTALPMPRAPILGKQYWHKYMKGRKCEATINPDPWLGYCTDVLAALGECSAVLEQWFVGSIAKDEYEQEKWELFLRLEEAQYDLPRPIALDPDVGVGSKRNKRIRLHNECVSAAVAHALASKIFLLRATNFSQESSSITELTEKLEEAVDGVPVDSTAVTIMLWPLWVLGCESFVATTRRGPLIQRFEELYEKEHIMNVKACLDMLQVCIWPLAKKPVKGFERDRGQAGWVRYCWDEGIRLIFA